MAGVYIHIPFCRQKCRYCDFYSVASDTLKEPMLAALHRELEERRNELNGQKVSTIYIGGGTPTVYTPEELQDLIDKVKSVYPVGNLDEITVEANPDDLTDDYLARLATTEIDRLSVGIQSFRDAHLQLFNRRHTGRQALEAVRRARSYGFENITADLIYGIPGMTEAEWVENLQLFLRLEIPHLSAYHLGIEPRTVFGKWAEQGKISPVPEEASERQYRILEQITGSAGYAHYEISNFALPGKEAVHNSNYWNGTPYIGIGPAAHSYDGRTRRWNTAANRTYLEPIASGDYFETEQLSETDRFNEALMTGLRTAKGVSWERIRTEFGTEKENRLRQNVLKFLESGLLVDDGQSCRIPSVYFLRSDSIISDLFAI